MATSLVLTVLGDDRPGLVELLSSVISEHQGSWQESSMSRLAGKFAGIVRVDVLDDKQVAPLKAALAALPHLRVTAEATSDTAQEASQRHLALSLVGQDRIGIVREVTQVLARHGVNVEEFATHTTSAPMGAGMMFHARADLRAPTTLDAQSLKRALEKISDELIVDINLDEITPL